MTNPVIVSVEGGIGVITLNRPEKLNAWDTPMRNLVAEALTEFNVDDSVRAVIITGSGDLAFCAGQDLAETQSFESGEDGREWFLSWRGFYDSIRRLDKGCVAALNGVAAGSAFQFALLADVRVGHAGVRMGQPEINSGIPSVLGPMLMMSPLGHSRTVELTLTGRMMEASECHQLGLLHHLVSATEVMSKAREVADVLASKPPIAMRLTKQRFYQVTQPAFDEAFEAGQRIEAEAFDSGEPQHSMDEFFSKRGD
tara:strand:+ start:312 stop:1076 length:765 start_codon:yes stop_codon:yes gene_type:complete